MPKPVGSVGLPFGLPSSDKLSGSLLSKECKDRVRKVAKNSWPNKLSLGTDVPNASQGQKRRNLILRMFVEPYQKRGSK